MSKRKHMEPILIRQARERAEKVKLILLLLELELRLFRDGNEEVRNVFRQELDEGDVGYVGCLLTSLTGTEEQFERWLAFSTYKFNFFKRKGLRR